MQANLEVEGYSAGPSTAYSSGQKDQWQQMVERLLGVWGIGPAGPKTGVGIRQEGTLLADGDGHEGLCRPHQELELNFEGHRRPQQDFQQTSNRFLSLETFFWLW